MTISQQHHPYLQQAYFLLRLVFIIVPILLGLDKFFDFFTHWEQYFVNPIYGTKSHTILAIVGIVEMIAGIGVIFRPSFFANILAIWIALIGINLIVLGKFIDIAILNFGLSLSAVAFGKLAKSFAS